MDEPGVGRFLVAMSVQGVVFIALVFFIELRCIRTLLNLFRRRKKVGEEGKYAAKIWLVCMVLVTITGVCVCQALLLAEEALQPEDRDVAEERKRVLDCQPVVESMVGSPLILQEISKVCRHIWSFCNDLIYRHANSTLSLPQCPKCTKPVGWHHHLLAKVYKTCRKSIISKLLENNLA